MLEQVLASQILPPLRKLACTPSYASWLGPLMPGEWSYLWNGAVHTAQQGAGNQALGGLAAAPAGPGGSEAGGQLSELVEGISLEAEADPDVAAKLQEEEDPIVEGD
jgi:hypothetical protein